MARHKPVPHTPAIREQLTQIELHQHLVDLANAAQLERELVARVLMEGGTWADVAAATGTSPRAARRRWSALPAGSAKETKAALAAAQASGGRGWRGPRLSS